MKNTFYEIWFLDGSRQIFRPEQINDYARRFGFCPSELASKQDISLLDDDGDIVGGVQVI